MPTENHTTLTPDTPVRYLKGVGPKTAERFEKLGIVTLAALLCHYPRRYIDFTKPYSIAEAPADVECVVKAEVFAKPDVYKRQVYSSLRCAGLKPSISGSARLTMTLMA